MSPGLLVKYPLDLLHHRAKGRVSAIGPRRPRCRALQSASSRLSDASVLPDGLFALWRSVQAPCRFLRPPLALAIAGRSYFSDSLLVPVFEPNRFLSSIEPHGLLSACVTHAWFFLNARR